MATVRRIWRGSALGDTWTDATPVPPLNTDTSSVSGPIDFTDSDGSETTIPAGGSLPTLTVTANAVPWALIVILGGLAVYFGLLYRKKKRRK
jgi:hypothetical protein